MPTKNKLTVITALLAFGNKIERCTLTYDNQTPAPMVRREGHPDEEMPWSTILFKFVKLVNRQEYSGIL